jgi:hypothetical protein
MGVGIALIILGVGGYFGTGQTSLTALIPAGFGLVFLILGFLARKDQLRKHAMHAAAALGLVGCVVPAVMGIPKLVRLASGQEVERPGAAISQSIMAVICGVFVVLCVRSFIAARRARRGTVD